MGLPILGFAAPAEVSCSDPHAATPKLRLTIHPPKGIIHLGERIPIECQIFNPNREEKVVFVDESIPGHGNFSLTAYDVVGHLVKSPEEINPHALVMAGCPPRIIVGPGQTATLILPLNAWALIKKPGEYRITAQTELPADGGVVTSDQPITVRIMERNEPALRSDVAELEKEYRRIVADCSAGKSDLQPEKSQPVAIQATEEELQNIRKIEDAIWRLGFTSHPQAIPPLTEALYVPGGRVAGEALRHYFADYPGDIKTAILALGRVRGLAPDTLFVLEPCKLSEEELAPLIQASLAPQNRGAWANGALAAQIHGRDEFVPRLAAIAADPTSGARIQAIYALAMHRTDESVKTLKKLADDPDVRIRATTQQAIQRAFRYRGCAKGRPLKKEDFPDPTRQQ
ncbi:MAG: hypothetical protein PHV34_18460 [Verrucomicrobiae bacterium]|nr:hypothetical protein [Verrucomicrobiae bacterium]